MGIIQNISKNFFGWIGKKLNQYSSTFDWSKSESQQVDKTRISITRPAYKNYSEELTVNSSLTRGFYYNTYPGLKLAGAFAATPIDKPIQFMGLPIPSTDNERLQKFLDNYMEKNIELFKAIHRVSHIEGTCWIWPWFDSESRKVFIEFIPDDTVTIIKNLNTGELEKIVTDEQLTVIYKEDGTTTEIRRRRIFTKEKITIIWPMKGQLGSQLENIEYANPIKMLPIPFTNNKEHGKIRGHSDYARILPDAKNYHDVDEQFSIILAKFNVKMVQTTSDVVQWKKNQEITSLADLNILALDLLVNTLDEKTEFIFPGTDAANSFEKRLNITYWKMVEGSGIPEIFWGLNAQGNHASVEDSRGDLVKFVKDKRQQHTESYYSFFNALLILYKLSTLETTNILRVEWNQLDSLDEKVKSEIFKNFAAGIKTLIDAAGATKKQIYLLWLELYPQATEEEFEIFVKGISEMAKHKSFRDADYEMITDLNGDEGDEEMNDQDGVR